jgi:hypothetical protein
MSIDEGNRCDYLWHYVTIWYVRNTEIIYVYWTLYYIVRRHGRGIYFFFEALLQIGKNCLKVKPLVFYFNHLGFSVLKYMMVWPWPTCNCLSKDCCSKIWTRFVSLNLRFGLIILSALWIWYSPMGSVLSLKYEITSTNNLWVIVCAANCVKKVVWLEICKLIFHKICIVFWTLYVMAE